MKTLGSKVRAQTDIREIANDTVPLWFDGLDPKKINFGLAAYGRGYTLADPECNSLGCAFSGPSKPAPCTNFDGVMSLVEIKQLIQQRDLTPRYLADSMIKQITWDDQWIGYDDEVTFAAKKAFADGLCFGGSMVWSVDFLVDGSGSGNDYTSTNPADDPSHEDAATERSDFLVRVKGDFESDCYVDGDCRDTSFPSACDRGYTSMGVDLSTCNSNGGDVSLSGH